MLNAVKYKVMTKFFSELLWIPNTGNIRYKEHIVIIKPILTFNKLSIKDCFLVCMTE